MTQYANALTSHCSFFSIGCTNIAAFPQLCDSVCRKLIPYENVVERMTGIFDRNFQMIHVYRVEDRFRNFTCMNFCLFSVSVCLDLVTCFT